MMTIFGGRGSTGASGRDGTRRACRTSTRATRAAARMRALIAANAPILLATTLGVAAGPALAQTFGLSDYSGAELFDRFCAACHGSSGRGDGPVAPTLNVAVPDLTRLAERNDGTFPAQDVRAVIDGRALVVAHGPRTMPVWGYEFWVEEGGDIEAERNARELIDRLVRHIESIQETMAPGGQVR
ncbi:MAG: cytochrome c [Gammaproteobacteria bacterium]